ncbi:MAG: DUF1440 domain-containing protein [Chloroflexota bacterium]|nr:DUF1440 domain-containing protein [Chloroflexota bacterium]
MTIGVGNMKSCDPMGPASDPASPHRRPHPVVWSQRLRFCPVATRSASIWNGERTLAWALHFAFGASAGMLYAGLLARVPLPAWLKGTAFGIVAWVGSYFGWLPSQQIHGQGDEQTWRRNALMLAAHLVWGTTLGMLVMQRMPGGEDVPSCFAGRPRDVAHAS